MIDKNLVELGFQDFYEELWRRRSVVDILGTRPDALLYEAYKAAAARFYAEGVKEGDRRAEERRLRVQASRAEGEEQLRRYRRPTERPQPPAPVVTSSNPEGTASGTHIPIVIEGTIELDRNRPVGEYLDDYR